MDIGLRHAMLARPDRRASYAQPTATTAAIGHVFLGSRFRLRLPSHPASRRRSCHWLVVGAINLHRGLSPPSRWSCRAYIGYARVSTRAQDLALQLDALEHAGCERVYQDVGSGSIRSRPQLDACLEHLLPGDTLVVWRLDRLGRSLRHLIDVIADSSSARSRSDRCARASTPRPPPAACNCTCSPRLLSSNAS